MSCKFHKAIFHAVLAAALYAVSIPFSKLLLVEVPPTMLAAFLYIGAGIGMAVLGIVKKNRSEEPLQRSDIKYTISMVVLDIVAPILLMLGLKFSPAANASLLNNFEIVATAVIALVVFGETVGKRLWTAIAPFIGVVLSMLILGERPNWIFFMALAIMLVGTRLASVKVEEYNLKRTIYFLTMDVNRNIIPFAQIIC